MAEKSNSSKSLFEQTALTLAVIAPVAFFSFLGGFLLAICCLISVVYAFANYFPVFTP